MRLSCIGIDRGVDDFNRLPVALDQFMKMLHRHGSWLEIKIAPKRPTHHVAQGLVLLADGVLEVR
jgi:hypothetical protein